MIIDAQGNLLDDEADVLVNTVNTVGVMGKGIALQFKRRFPVMFKAYEKEARAKRLRLGQVHVWPTGTLEPPRYVINFPTKGHWRSRSKLSDIDQGLADLVRVLSELDVRSVAVPPLGCGNGGLAWTQVKPVIQRAFADAPHIEVHLYAPDGAPAPAEMADHTPRPSMTVGKASLVELASRFAALALEVTLIDVQKLMYFLQVSGEALKLDYAKGPYGPYADNLRKSLRSMEGHYITGYGDGSKPVFSADPIELVDGATDLAAAVLADKPGTNAHIARVIELAEGYESPYGMELLSTVHWVSTREDLSAAGDPNRAVEFVAAWNKRKARMFTRDHVVRASNHLHDLGWI